MTRNVAASREICCVNKNALRRGGQEARAAALTLLAFFQIVLAFPVDSLHIGVSASGRAPPNVCWNASLRIENFVSRSLDRAALNDRKSL
jgi:hypothetical protein